jgi:hypothetical protein
MAIIHGKIDSLSKILSFLAMEGVTFLSSLDDIISFKQNYGAEIDKTKKEVLCDISTEIEEKKEIITNLTEDFIERLTERENILKEEKNEISKKIVKYSIRTNNVFLWIYNKYKYYVLNKRLNVLLNDFDEEKKRPFKELEQRINHKKKELSNLENITEKEIQRRVELKAGVYIKAKDILAENNNLFLGAVGEQKAVDELKKLPDTYRVINNFRLNLRKPIYNKNTGQRIYSIQSDHIVVGPSGIFMIETKNWSKESIENLDLYSPVEQVRRSSFTLFCYLNNSVERGILSFFKDGWGSRKISIRNIILMINAKPSKEYQHVKILNLSEVCGYIKYFEPVFSEEEVNQISNYLLY